MSKDGTVEDWDTATNLWEYAITSRLTNAKPSNPMTNGLNDKSNGDVDVEMEGVEEQEKPLEENPLLMTETGWNSGKSREKAIEIAMENWACPAFWLARNGVLAAYVASTSSPVHELLQTLTTTHSSFASGKPSALVIDIGASNISITPVHDGLLLKKGIARSPLASNFISDQLRLLFSTSNPPISLTPPTAPHPSFRRLQEERVLTEFKESVIQVWPGPGRLSSHTPHGSTNEAIAAAQPGRPFEFPDGYNQLFGAERYRAAEGLFDAKMALGDAPPPPGQTLPALIQSCLGQVDVDIRPHLLGNVVVTGGGSLLYGFTDRVNHELMALYPGPRVRITAPGNTVERRFASWIGGSILASLGTFHQVCLAVLWGCCAGGVAECERRCGFRRRSMMSMVLGSWRRGVSDGVGGYLGSEKISGSGDLQRFKSGRIESRSSAWNFSGPLDLDTKFITRSRKRVDFVVNKYRLSNRRLKTSRN